RHEIRQRKRRDRSGEDHLDLAGTRGGCVEGEDRRGDAKADAKTSAERTQSNRNVRQDNSLRPPRGEPHGDLEKLTFRTIHANSFSAISRTRSEQRLCNWSAWPCFGARCGPGLRPSRCLRRSPPQWVVSTRRRSFGRSGRSASSRPTPLVAIPMAWRG